MSSSPPPLSRPTSSRPTFASEATSQALRVDVSPIATALFDEYLLVAKLGHGGMAEVFLAMTRGPSGFVKLSVIKRLHPHLEEDPATVQMFLDEARLAARLSHPHVVQTHKVGTWNGRHFLAMEYLEGQPVNRLFVAAAKRDGRIPIAMVARIIADSLEGLHYAHEAHDYDGTPFGIVHRDISPHNLFITYEGMAKVLDFGIAKASISQAHTRTGTIKGKFAYIAPEQARGTAVDRRADLWSMGVVLWEALAGRRLFKGPNEAATLEMALLRPIPKLEQVDPNIPAELVRVADRALQRDPAKRYQSALEMKEELEEWLSTQSKLSSHSAVAEYVRDLFAPVIEQQAEVIKQCVETSRAVDAAELEAERQSLTELDGQRSNTAVTAMPQPEEDRRRGRMLPLVFAALVFFAGGVGLTWFFGMREGAGAAAANTSGAGVPEAQLASEENEPAEPTAEATATASAEPESSVAAEASSTPKAGDRGPDVKKAAVAKPGKVAMGRPAPAVVAQPPPAPEQPAQPEYGYLTIDTTPWSIVTANGRSLGQTPVVGARLKPGTYVIGMRNPELNISSSYSVKIEPGKTVVRRLGLQ